MRQILIVKNNTTFNSGVTDGRDLTSLQNGALVIYSLTDYKPITAAPKTNFAIALGRPNGQAPFIISEVDASSLKVEKVIPSDGSQFEFEFTIPTPVANTDYTIRLFKKGVVPYERNSWTVQYRTGDTPCTAAQLASKLKTQIDVKLSDKFDITATVNQAKITLTANSAWEGMLIDGLANATPTKTLFKPAIGDKAYIENLAKSCAGGKGFNYTHSEGVDAIPGYPETVEDIKYTVYNLRFKVHRDAARTIDLGVWQEVNIAVPKDGAIKTTLDKMFIETEPNTVNESDE